MANLKRDRSGDWILRYWTNARRSRLDPPGRNPRLTR
jgi:hypothetical protein